MARIIETENSTRRIIKLSTDDIISVVQAYQTTRQKATDIDEIRNRLEDTVIFIPEDV